MFIRKSSGTGHQGALYALALSHKAGCFLSAGGDGWITEWQIADTETGRVVAQVNDKIFSLCVPPAEWPEPLILAGTMSGGLHWINRDEPALTRNIQHHPKGIFDILWLDGEVLSLDGSGFLTRWDPVSKRAVESLQLSHRALRCIAHNEQQQLLAIGASDGNIYYLNSTDWSLMDKVSAHEHSVFSLAWTPDGQRLISGGRDAMLRVWEHRRTQVSAQPAHWYTINHIALSPDGKHAATASRDKTIRIWNISDMTLVKTLETIRDLGHINSVNRLLWYDHQTLLSCSDDRTVIVWEKEEKPS